MSTMAYYNSVTALTGKEDLSGIDAAVQLKTNEELLRIAEYTQNSYLTHHVVINQMYVYCYFRKYLPLATLAEEHLTRTQEKRILDFYFVFFQGICKPTFFAKHILFVVLAL